MFLSENVITGSDAEWIYEIPLLLAKEGVHKGILKKLSLPQKTPKLQDWQKIVRKFKAKRKEISIGIVGLISAEILQTEITERALRLPFEIRSKCQRKESAFL